MHPSPLGVSPYSAGKEGLEPLMLQAARPWCLDLNPEMLASASSGIAQFPGSYAEGNNSYCLLNACCVEGTGGRNSACYLINSHNSSVNQCHHVHLTNEETEAPAGK